ncbi:MAG: O-antigen ligase family protein [Candidatus Sumerlaeaceae bacterium]|nr:O-antigen ligase family protein [Candidatus Sumerlaeaceae bacterium]
MFACLFAAISFVAVRYGGPLAVGGIIGLAFLSVVLAVHPFVFFALYFGALFFADTKLPGLPLSINQILAGLFLVSWLAYAWRGRTMAIRSRLLPWLTLMALYFAANALLGESPSHGQIMARYVLIYYGIAIILATCLRSERAIYAYAWIVVTLTFIAAVGGLVEAFQRGTFWAFTGKITDAVRVKGTASTANVYGWNLLFAYPFAFFLFSQMQRRGERFLALAMGIIILFVALLTLSRQTIVLVGLLLITCAKVFRYPNRRQVLAVILAFIALGVVLVAPAIVARFVSVTRLSRDYSYLERRDSALICMEVIKARPVFGVGLGSYTAVWRNYLPSDYRTFFAQYVEASRPRAPDQGYLQITAEGGFVGLTIFLVFVVILGRRISVIRKFAAARDDSLAYNLAALVFALFVQFLATTFTDDTFLYVRVWLIYPLALLLDERMLWSDPPNTANDYRPENEPAEDISS